MIQRSLLAYSFYQNPLISTFFSRRNITKLSCSLRLYYSWKCSVLWYWKFPFIFQSCHKHSQKFGMPLKLDTVGLLTWVVRIRLSPRFVSLRLLHLEILCPRILSLVSFPTYYQRWWLQGKRECLCWYIVVSCDKARTLFVSGGQWFLAVRLATISLAECVWNIYISLNNTGMMVHQLFENTLLISLYKPLMPHEARAHLLLTVCSFYFEKPHFSHRTVTTRDHTLSLYQSHFRKFRARPLTLPSSIQYRCSHLSCQKFTWSQDHSLISKQKQSWINGIQQRKCVCNHRRLLHICSRNSSLLFFPPTS